MLALILEKERKALWINKMVLYGQWMSSYRVELECKFILFIDEGKSDFEGQWNGSVCEGTYVWADRGISPWNLLWKGRKKQFPIDIYTHTHTHSHTQTYMHTHTQIHHGMCTPILVHTTVINKKYRIGLQYHINLVFILALLLLVSKGEALCPLQVSVSLTLKWMQNSSHQILI